MKIVILNATGQVIAMAISPNEWATVTHPDGVRTIRLPDVSPVAVGWQHTEPPPPKADDALPENKPDAAQDVTAVPLPGGLVDLSGEFTAPAATYAPIDATHFYLCFTSKERIAIKGSNDPLVKEFWDTYKIYAESNLQIDPNSSEVRTALEYFAQPTNAVPAGAGIFKNAGRVEQIMLGQLPT